MNSLLDLQGLRAALASATPPTLIHVLPEDAFEEAHVPGSRCFCAYESAFTQKVGESFPDKASPLVVYSLDDQTLEAETAAGRLRAAGYSNVVRLAGGLQAWREGGGTVEGTGPRDIAPLSGKFSLDAARSVIFWTGRNLFNHHHGSIALASGSADLAQGRLTAARFIIDMNSITCADLADTALNGMLVAHLKSEDFFAVQRHPTAEFVAVDASPVAGCTSSTPNYTISGDFTLRGETHSLAFPALIAQAPDGSLTAQAEFDFDRTRWGAVYGSGKFFARLGQHVVNDLIHLHLKLVFVPEPAK